MASEAETQDRTDDRLARAALELFDRKGFDATTIDDIAEAAGVSRRTFFRHFPRKESVILFEQEAIHRQVRARLERLQPGVSALDDFIAGTRAMLRHAGGDPQRLQLRTKLINAIPELASVERNADAVTVEIFASVFAAELGGGAAAMVRAMSVGAAITAAGNAALAASLNGEDALALFDMAAASIQGWTPSVPTRRFAAVLEAPATLSDEEVMRRLRAALFPGSRSGAEPH